MDNIYEMRKVKSV